VIRFNTLDDLADLSESIDVECKLAAGADGKGRLPREFWPTYSAFANTRGGVILLGIREDCGRFTVHGVDESDRVITDLFNTVNNPDKVSINLLADAHVRRLAIDGRELIAVEVPAAGRKQKPVYLNGNPLRGNTYRRLHDGDRRCDEETVRRLMAERVHDSRDIHVLKGSSLADLDTESLQAYRNMMGGFRPDHPWTSVDNLSLLRALGAWRHDPETQDEGLTLAGVLMLGQWPAINEALPYYFVDYQEWPTEEAREQDVRWLDRVIPDGTWSGNLFDFYLRAVRRLFADIKVPFALKDNIRQDDTPVHKALREAMVNALVHADYSDRASLLVIKQPTGFIFRNPGVLRVPAAVALQGGASDCRNRTLQRMFLMIGLGERAGSGMAKIQRGWAQTGGTLRLIDSFEPYDQTRLEMDFARPADSGRDSGMAGILAAKMAGEVAGKRAGIVAGMILQLMAEKPEISIPDIAVTLGKSRRSIERTVRELKSDGKVTRIGPGRGGRWDVTSDT
jgi:predicted HTH transcriptional regulator